MIFFSVKYKIPSCPNFTNSSKSNCSIIYSIMFIIIDGEVHNVEDFLDLISTNSKDRRCFSIGIDRDCNEIFVKSNRKCDFVQEGDSISEKGNFTSLCF